MDSKEIGTAIVIVGIAAGIVFFLSIGIRQYTDGIQQADTQHVEFCNEWKLQIEQQRSELTAKWFPLDSEWSAFNQQVNDFNLQCAS